MGQSLYKAAGVDIDAKYASVEAARKAIRSTFTAGVESDIGLFGGLFDPAAAGARDQVLVASTDGVGTKVKVATMMRRYDSVGHCIVNHSINDILVQGARPLFFLDYIGTGRLEPEVVTSILEGIAAACRDAGCALLGGETAEMPGMYPDGHFEIVGTIVGAVAREKLLDGSRVGEGDVVIALPSNGLHTNGYSLARKVLFEDLGLAVDARPEGHARTVGEALLAVHLSYLDPVMPLLERDDAVHACAHITGGGVLDNLPRVLPEGLAAEIDPSSVSVPEIMEFIVEQGGVAREEAYRVFNMGFGFLLVVEAARADAVVADLHERGHTASVAGRIVAGEREVHLA